MLYTAVEGDCRVFLGGEAKSVICGGGEMPDFTLKPLFHTFGAAVDIGTTTLAARLYGHKGRWRRLPASIRKIDTGRM